MACNCKSKRDFNNIAKMAEPINDVDNVNEGLNIKVAFKTIISGVLRIFFGFLLFILFIVVSVPILLYAGICMIIGVNPEIRLINPFKNNRNE